MKIILIVTFSSVLCFGQQRQDILKIASAPRFDIGRGLLWNTSGVGGVNNNFIFNTSTWQQPVSGICVYAVNNDTANSHTINFNAYISGSTADPLQFTGNFGAWVNPQAQESLTLPAAGSLTGLPSTNNSPSGVVTFATPGAVHIALNVVDNAVAGGTVDIYVSQSLAGNPGSCGGIFPFIAVGGTNVIVPGNLYPPVNIGAQYTTVGGPQPNLEPLQGYATQAAGGTNGLPVVLVTTPPVEWSVVSATAAGSAATATKAGAANLRHVVNCASFSAVSTGAVAALLTTNFQILDGATVVWQADSALVTAAAASAILISGNVINFCGLNIVGSVNTAMVAQFSAGEANAQERVSLSGYDIQ